jgi:hypothetical protein
MAIWIINNEEFKENITIKSGWNARSIFNPKCIIIQFFNSKVAWRAKDIALKHSRTLKTKR